MRLPWPKWPFFARKKIITGEISNWALVQIIIAFEEKNQTSEKNLWLWLDWTEARSPSVSPLLSLLPILEIRSWGELAHFRNTRFIFLSFFSTVVMVRCTYYKVSVQDSAWYSYKSATQNSIYIFKIYSVLRVGTLLRFPSLLRSNQVSGILERGGNLTDFSKTQYDSWQAINLEQCQGNSK